MFEAAEIGQKLSKEEFNARLTPLREQLITAQYQLRSAKFPVIVLIAGVDRVGAHELITFLTTRDILRCRVLGRRRRKKRNARSTGVTGGPFHRLGGWA